MQITRDRVSKENLLNVYLPAFILAAGVGISIPALPLFTKSFEVDFGTASLVVIVNQLGAVAATLPSGYLIDRIGGRRVLLAGPIISCVAALLTAMAHSFPELLVYRFLDGWANQMWTLGRMEVITAQGGSNRGTQITGMFGMDAAGRLMGPAFGGLIAAYWDLRAPFVLYGLVALAAIVPSFFLEREPAHEVSGEKGHRGGGGVGTRAALASMMTIPIVLLFVTQFLSFVTRGAMFGGTLDLYAVYAYGIGPETVGFLAVAGGVLGLPLTFISGHIMDRFGRMQLIVPGFLVLSSSLFLMSWAAHAAWPFEWWAATFLFSRVATSVVSGVMQVLGSDAAPPRARGTFLGIFGLVRQGGSFCSPVAFALVAQLANFAAAFAMLGVLAVATAVLTTKLLWGKASKVGV